MSAVVSDLAGENKLEVRIFVEQPVNCARGELHDEKVVRRAPDVEIDQGVPLLRGGSVARRAGALQRDVRSVLIYYAIEQGLFKRTCVSRSGSGDGHGRMLLVEYLI
jgi:hypothetical protein